MCASAFAACPDSRTSTRATSPTTRARSATANHGWVQNAPRAVCVTEFTAGNEDGRDDPRNFLVFTPEPLSIGGYAPRPDEFVSPYADAIVRFTKPVDIDTVKWADTFFFAMRDLTSRDSIDDFITERQIDPGRFDEAKYRTPFLITSRVIDENGSQTSLRLQPTLGFYLDGTMRDPPAGADFRYFLHLISDSDEGGIRDLAGNRLDLQGTTSERSSHVVIPFTLDTRIVDGDPVFPDNLAISVVRRFASRDEDERPSYFLDDEVPQPGETPQAGSYPLQDLFGSHLYLDNRLRARETARIRHIADNLNQSPVQQQSPEEFAPNALAWCPQTMFDPNPNATEDMVGSNSASNLSAGAVQNPLNPSGCRLQTLWREVDLSLSRDNPFDFNLDIEAMYWAPFRDAQLSFDEFDDVRLVLGHSEYRPVPCVGDFSSLPSLPESGLRAEFERNYLWNPRPEGAGGQTESQAPRREAFSWTQLRINASDAVREPNGINRFMPLPRFERPYFVWRDETVVEQGGDSDKGSDLTTVQGGLIGQTYPPYILSPFNNGQGGRWVDQGGVTFVNAYWNDCRNFDLAGPSTRDRFTGGLVGAIGLPLLADFQTLPDNSEEPLGAGFIAFGTNGWQTSLAVQSDPRPRFRVLSAGRPGAAPQGPLAMGPGNEGWNTAVGGWGPNPTSASALVIVGRHRRAARGRCLRAPTSRATTRSTG